MRTFILFIFLLTITGCAAQKQKQTKQDAFNVSHGVVVNTIDSGLIKDIRYIHFDNSKGVIFPAEYGRKKFGKNFYSQQRTFFTPDTLLIKNIDTAIINQYCKATIRFNDSVWKRTIESLKEDNDIESLKRAEMQMKTSQEQFNKLCPKWQQDLKYFDKQYIGFINGAGEKIIYIQLCDFRQDPYKLKSIFNTAWVDGWHGWFETNTKRLHFHLDTNELTINKDL